MGEDVDASAEQPKCSTAASRGQVELPFVANQGGDCSTRGAEVGPFQDVLGASRLRTQQLGARARTHPQQVQSVGIPANLNCQIGNRLSGRMLGASELQQREAVLIQIEFEAAEFAGKIPTAPAVSSVDGFIPSARIVEYRKQLDHIQVRAGDFCQGAAILHDPPPMRRAVNPANGQRVPLKDMIYQRCTNDAHLSCQPRTYRQEVEPDGSTPTSYGRQDCTPSAAEAVGQPSLMGGRESGLCGDPGRLKSLSESL